MKTKTTQVSQKAKFFILPRLAGIITAIAAFSLFTACEQNGDSSNPSANDGKDKDEAELTINGVKTNTNALGRMLEEIEQTTTYMTVQEAARAWADKGRLVAYPKFRHTMTFLDRECTNWSMRNTHAGAFPVIDTDGRSYVKTLWDEGPDGRATVVYIKFKEMTDRPENTHLTEEKTREEALEIQGSIDQKYPNFAKEAQELSITI